jgi:hypothetical protein
MAFKYVVATLPPNGVSLESLGKRNSIPSPPFGVSYVIAEKGILRSITNTTTRKTLSNTK